MSAAGAAVLITAVTLLGGIGVLPNDAPAAASSGSADVAEGARIVAQRSSRDSAPATTTATTATTPTVAPSAPDRPSAASATALPAASGAGRRVVFDMSEQRVWLVGADGTVQRTYLVSGSLTHNLRPGTYAVYSRSRWAVGIDDSGTMQYFVRFTRGANAAIGFHSIPVKDGRPLQSADQLGTPQSHGCIRQLLQDARRLWAFAPEGTKVVVTA